MAPFEPTTSRSCGNQVNHSTTRVVVIFSFTAIRKDSTRTNATRCEPTTSTSATPTAPRWTRRNDDQRRRRRHRNDNRRRNERRVERRRRRRCTETSRPHTTRSGVESRRRRLRATATATSSTSSIIASRKVSRSPIGPCPWRA